MKTARFNTSSILKPTTLLQRILAAGLFSLAMTGLVTTVLMSLAYSSKAEACRDCPFPMKTGEDHWLMPNGQIEVTIKQRELSDGTIETKIELHLISTGQLLAAGRVVTPHGQTNVTTQLEDSEGKQFEFEIVWVDEKHDRVQIGMHCLSDSCAVGNEANKYW